MSKKQYDMAVSYVQACWDCGVTPDKRTFKKIKRQQQEQWGIAELDSDRRKYYEED